MTAGALAAADGVPAARPRRGPSLRGRLLLLVTACVLPMVVFGLGDAYLTYRAERAEAGRRTLDLARSLALTVERDVQGRLAALQVLALSPTLREGDIESFRPAAEAMLAQQMPGADILLLREDGQQVLNTVVPPGEPLLARRDTTTLRRLFATGLPSVSDVFVGATLRRPIVALEVPVFGPGGKVVLGMALNPTTDAFADILRRQRLPEAWTLGLYDGRGAFVARSRDGERVAGQPAGPLLLPRLLSDREGVLDAISRDGVPVLTAFSRIESFGWTAAVSVPLAEVAAPAWRSALRTLASGTAFLLAGLGLALLVARRITGPIASLHDLAAASDRDRPPAAPPGTGFAEVDEMAEVLVSGARERRTAEAARRASEERLRLAQESGGVGVWDWTLATGEVNFCPTMGRIYGLPPGSVRTYSDWRRLVHPNDIGRVEAERDSALARGKPCDLEFRVFHASGEVRWIVARGRAMHGADGRIVQVIGVNLDVTALRRATEALREGELRLRLALDASQLGTWLWEVGRGGELVWDARCKALFGLPPEAPVDYAAWAAAIPPEDRPAAEAGVARALDPADPHDGYSCEYRAKHPGGQVVWLQAIGRAVFEPDPAAPAGRRAVRILGTILDVTERRANAERQKLLLREVDHRAKNALAVALSLVRLAPRDDAGRFAAGVEGRIAAMARAHSLLAEGRWDGADLRALAMGELAAYADRVKLDGPPARLSADAAQPVAMLLHELATNAAKYGALSEPAGKVALSWGFGGADAGLRLRWAEKGGPAVAGPPARGGFGSRLLNSLAERQLGGRLVLDWEPDGLRATLALPPRHASPDAPDAAGARAEPSPAPAPAAAGAKGHHHRPTPRVLVVEDKALLALEIEAELGALGCEVVGPARTLDEAMRLAASGPEPDAAVLDVNLGGELVFPVADLLAARGVPVLFATGYGSAPSLEGRQTAAVAVLCKPYPREALAAALARALERRAAAAA